MRDQLQLIDQLLARREVKKAEILIAKALRGAQNRADKALLLTRRARVRLLSARPQDALDDLDEISRDDGALADTPALQELLADCLFARFELSSVGFADRGDTARALDLYRRMVARFPDYDNLGWVYYQMGRAYLVDNLVEQAAACFQDALLKPSHVPALTAYCYERLGFIAFYEERNSSKALGFINKSIATYPPQEDRRWLVQVHLLKSRILRETRQAAHALRAAEDALAIAESGHADHRGSLSEAYLTAGELSSELDGHERDVIHYLQQFLQTSRKPLGVDVTWSRVHEMLGDAYFRSGQYGAAAAAFQSALDYNPYHPWEVSLYYRMARSFYQQAEYERTIQAIQRMLVAAEAEGDPVSDYRVYDVLGSAQFALKRYEQAKEAYQIAMRMAPPNADLDVIKTYHDFAQILSRPV